PLSGQGGASLRSRSKRSALVPVAPPEAVRKLVSRRSSLPRAAVLLIGRRLVSRYCWPAAAHEWALHRLILPGAAEAAARWLPSGARLPAAAPLYSFASSR